MIKHFIFIIFIFCLNAYSIMPDDIYKLSDLKLLNAVIFIALSPYPFAPRTGPGRLAKIFLRYATENLSL